MGDRFFWFHLREIEGDLKGVRGREVTTILQRWKALVVAVARARKRISPNYPEMMFDLYLVTTAFRGGSFAFGLSFNPAMPWSDTFESTFEDVKDLLICLRDNNASGVEELFPARPARVRVLKKLRRICLRVRKTRVSYASLHEDFHNCPLDIELGTLESDLAETWIFLSKQGIPPRSLIGILVGAHSRTQFSIKLVPQGTEITCKYDLKMYPNVRSLIMEGDIRKGDLLFINGTFSEKVGQESYIENVRGVQKVDKETTMRTWRQLVTRDPRVCHGKPCFQGTRLLVSVVLALVREGLTDDEIKVELPSVTQDQLNVTRQAVHFFA